MRIQRMAGLPSRQAALTLTYGVQMVHNEQPRSKLRGILKQRELMI